MPLSPDKSSQYTLYASEPPQAVNGAEWDAKPRYAYGKLTFTAAGQGTAKIARLPAGRKLILPDMSRISCPQGTASADLHVGHSAYTKPDGTAVPADDNAFMDNGDIGAGAVDVAFPLPAAPVYVLDSKEQVDIEAMIDTANSPAAGDLEVLIAYLTAR